MRLFFLGPMIARDLKTLASYWLHNLRRRQSALFQFSQGAFLSLSKNQSFIIIATKNRNFGQK